MIQVKFVPQPLLMQACSVGNTARLLVLDTQLPSLRHSHFESLRLEAAFVGALADNDIGNSQ